MEVQTPNLSEPTLGFKVVDTLARARAGDAEAFQAVFNRYSKPILSFVYSMLGNRGRSEEITQETFVRAYQRLNSMRQDTRLSTWLFGIARNVVRESIKEEYRKGRRIGLSGRAPGTLADKREGPDESLIAGELNRLIHKALAGLPEDHRVVFILKVMNKIPYEEISRITGASIGKLKTDLRRARLQMRRKLQPYLEAQVSGMRGGS